MSLMDNLSQIAKSVGDNASNMANNVAKKSADMIEIAKLNLAIQTEEEKIKNLQNEIGAILFAKFVSGGSVDPDIIENCTSITQVQNQILGIQHKIAKLKNINICEKCGQDIVPNSVFCPKCGEKQSIQQNEPTPTEEIKENICSTCGAKIEDGTTYCSGCGKNI